MTNKVRDENIKKLSDMIYEDTLRTRKNCDALAIKLLDSGLIFKSSAVEYVRLCPKCEGRMCHICHWIGIVLREGK